MVTDKVDLDWICKSLGLPSWDSVEEGNGEYLSEAYTAGLKSCDADATDEEREAAALKSEQEARDDLYRKWYDAVEYAANCVFEEHGLVLEGCRVRRKVVLRPYEFRVKPAKSWEDAACEIKETINGYGPLTFTSLREFLDYGPYTARQAVLSHLGWMKAHAEVYGRPSAKRLYEQAWR